MVDTFVTLGTVDGFVPPPRPKRGIKAYPVEHELIAKALDGFVDGLFETPGQAAYALASERYDRNDKRYNAFRLRLKRQLARFKY